MVGGGILPIDRERSVEGFEGIGGKIVLQVVDAARERLEGFAAVRVARRFLGTLDGSAVNEGD
jgi:hypothetical protein